MNQFKRVIPGPVIDSMNKFLVGGAGDDIIFFRPLPQRLRPEDALLLAAWIVAIVGDEDEFLRVLHAVQNT